MKCTCSLTPSVTERLIITYLTGLNKIELIIQFEGRRFQISNSTTRTVIVKKFHVTGHTQTHTSNKYHCIRSRNSSVGTATHYGLDGPGIESRWGGGHIFRTCPDRHYAHPASYNGYRVFTGGKAAGVWRWPTTPSSAEVEERIELYLYSVSGPSWSVLRWNLSLPLPLYPRAWFHFVCVRDESVCDMWGKRLMQNEKTELFANAPLPRCWPTLKEESGVQRQTQTCSFNVSSRCLYNADISSRKLKKKKKQLTAQWFCVRVPLTYVGTVNRRRRVQNCV
jgi:hypothetical protein